MIKSPDSAAHRRDLLNRPAVRVAATSPPYDLVLGLSAIFVLGIGAQWFAWRLRVPSILVLLLTGVFAGPITGLVRPEALLGDLLLPLVSLCVALILYEGGLTLRFSELPSAGAVVWRLVSIGALITWAGAFTAAILIVGLEWRLAILLGAVLTVTGPTVIGPLLREIRPTGVTGPILKWEGIVIDPIGALLAVLVFESIVAQTHTQFSYATRGGLAILETIFVGGGLGLLAAALLAVLLKRYWIPDHLHSSVSLMLAIGVFSAANRLQPESGLFAVTLMGILMANQRFVDVRHIVEFKENLRVLLIAILFILLGARIDLATLAGSGWREILFTVTLILIVRPLSVWIACAGTRLRLAEKAFLAWMAPRGVVAAAVSSVFALKLMNAGFGGADAVVSLTFVVIIVTVATYGLTAPLVARVLGLTIANPQGVIIVGAHDWARRIGEALLKRNVRVLIVDNNQENVAAARMAGLPTYAGNVLTDYALSEMDIGGVGRLLALTPNDAVNSLAAQRFAHAFGRKEVYQLPPKSGGEKADVSLFGRRLFGKTASFAAISERFEQGWSLKATPLTEEFTYKAFQAKYGANAVPLFLISKTGQMTVVAADEPTINPKPGQTIVALVPPEPPGD